MRYRRRRTTRRTYRGVRSYSRRRMTRRVRPLRIGYRF